MKMILRMLALLVALSGCGESKNYDEPTNKETNEEIPILPKIIEKEASTDEEVAYKKAHDLWYNSKTNEAIDSFKKFIEKFPESSLADDAQRMLGTSYGNLEDYQQAIEEYKKVKLDYPDGNSTPLALYDMAHLYFYSLNDFDKAKYYYQEFISAATEENLKFRNIALKQIEEWSEKTKQFEGYAERRKQYEKQQELEKQINNPTEFIEIVNHSWEKGGFETVGIHNVSIKNNADVTYKDIVFRFDYFSETNSFLGRSLRTAYKYLPPNKTIQINDLNTGFIPQDVKSAKVKIITALVE